MGGQLIQFKPAAMILMVGNCIKGYHLSKFKSY